MNKYPEENFSPTLSQAAFNYLKEQLNTVCINVPGSLLHAGVERRDAFLNTWNSTMKSPGGEVLPVTFLPNPCTPAEIVADAHLTSLAKCHDTFVSPALRKAIVAKQLAHISDPEEAKAKAIRLVELLILEHWDMCVELLKFLEFKNCCGMPATADFAVKHLGLQAVVYPKPGFLFYLAYPEDQHGNMLVGLLDALRTKLTRTACTESHCRAYAYLCQQPDKIGLLLEDDLYIDPRFPDQLSYLLPHLKTKAWDIVQLGYSVHAERPIVPYNSLLSVAPQGAYGNTAVLVRDPKTILQLLDAHRQGSGPILANDVVLAEASTLSRFLAAKRLIGPPKGEHLSELVGKAMDYSRFCWSEAELNDTCCLKH